ncbi:Der1-like family-domain-containing protein [Coprinopsis sp. MPI-PUGE-AT-0042]|nr:Der1-like family-domain-containing protein [Coprinopsis sp. MPI-PUGE-AT-0042]
MDQFLTELKKVPPVTRFMTLSLLGVTVPVIMNIVPYHRLMYATPLVFKQFQLWRLYTSFFLGSPGVHLIFQLAALYHNSKNLETGAFASRSSDYAWQVTLAAGAILLTTRPINSSTFRHAVIACLTYVGSKLAPAGAKISLNGLVAIPMVYWPYAMVVMDLLTLGRHAAAEAVAGLIVGQCWWWTMMGGGELGNPGRFSRYGQAPSWLFRWFSERKRGGSDAEVRPDSSGAAHALRASGVEVAVPRRVRDSASSTGHSWGQGRTLGS